MGDYRTVVDELMMRRRWAWLVAHAGSHALSGFLSRAVHYTSHVTWCKKFLAHELYFLAAYKKTRF